MDFEGYAILRSIYGSFDGHCGRQMVLRTICLILRTDLLCMGINTHVVCCGEGLERLVRQMHTQREFESILSKTHTHTLESLQVRFVNIVLVTGTFIRINTVVLIGEPCVLCFILASSRFACQLGFRTRQWVCITRFRFVILRRGTYKQEEEPNDLVEK